VGREQFFASTEGRPAVRDGRRVLPPLLVNGGWSLLGLRFVVVISQLLDAVQCGIASAARQGSALDHIELASNLRRHDMVNHCPFSGLIVRNSDNTHFLDEEMAWQ
jgi:hypothetical protein